MKRYINSVRSGNKIVDIAKLLALFMYLYIFFINIQNAFDNIIYISF